MMKKPSFLAHYVALSAHTCPESSGRFFGLGEELYGNVAFWLCLPIVPFLGALSLKSSLTFRSCPSALLRRPVTFHVLYSALLPSAMLNALLLFARVCLGHDLGHFSL